MADYQFEPASFRDRHSRVFYRGTEVLRLLDGDALKDWEALSSSRFFPQCQSQGKIVYTERIDTSRNAHLAPDGKWNAVLRHETIPFISYPYEWSFGMLKDAALLVLDLLGAAIDEEMILKDASAYNIQWKGARPTFIDIPSFQRLEPGTPWPGYRQFCQLFLFPLLLQAYKDIPFQPWLRGCIDGIEPAHCYRLISLRDLIRPGVLPHVYLQAKMEARHAHTQRNVRADLRSAGFHKDLIRINAERLVKTVKGLKWKRSKSQWLDYSGQNNYTDIDLQAKADFVQAIVRSRSWNLVWDLGCNTGVFSRIASENARYVVAMDSDELSVEHLYQSLKRDGITTILPLVSNITDASPNLGWRGLERMALAERGKPDLTLCLALIHHIVIGANIPLSDFIDWLASLGSAVVIEFVTKEDPMVKILLRNKADNYKDYEFSAFELSMANSFKIIQRKRLASGTRILYFAEPIRT